MIFRDLLLFAFSVCRAGRAPRASGSRRQSWLGLIGLMAAGGALSAAQFDLTTATVAEIQAAYNAGGLTAETFTALCLKRIETYEPTLNAVLALNPRALDEARALDAERKAKGPRGPLHGIPVVLKDNIDTADLPTTGGFFGLKGSLPPQDATLVARLRAAGAIILAKNNMSEFASGGAMSSLGGAMRNPHGLDRAPGGSSGGTGVAVAARYAPIGFGTDTGGSIRSPSTSNGIVGLKPTLGLLSRAGIIPLSLSLDTGGPMARSVYDLAVALEIRARELESKDDSAGAGQLFSRARETMEARLSRERGVRAPGAHNIEGDFGKGEEPVPKVVRKVSQGWWKKGWR